ncbi:hypothetical protein [Paraburkholderia hayleyella]|uniref:hypothetical protein n=1 Tax=Paraburkholderia hayleyella TaxID=2152889 RepID=UPI0012908FC6|nr:hypothetical protein [Paraburkholderia hayleyella]
MLTVLSLPPATQVRYSAHLHCPSKKGAFIAQINWDVGTPYYRLVACRAEDQSFVETAPIPLGAREGTLYITVRDAASAQIEDLQVDAH